MIFVLIDVDDDASYACDPVVVIWRVVLCIVTTVVSFMSDLFAELFVKVENQLFPFFHRGECKVLCIISEVPQYSPPIVCDIVQYMLYMYAKSMQK